MASIKDLLEKMIEAHASDLHLIYGSKPLFRVHGDMADMGYDKLSPEDVQKLCYSVMNESQQKEFEDKKQYDFSFGIANLGRFRANVYRQKGTVSMAIRFIPFEIKTVAELNLPAIMTDLIKKPSGLILVTGATGSGKSTTLAALIDWINENRKGHILTLEDPIEFVHKHKNCIVSQREIYSDTDSFSSALRVALRQDPDYVLIGELRDLDTVRSALTIAETGHLTLATLHTNSAVETINRIIDSFPEGEQAQVRTQLSFVLQGVISQVLVPNLHGGRTMAHEIMVATQGIRAMIRDDKVHQVQGMLETGQKYGMGTLNACLAKHVLAGLITKAQGLHYCSNEESFLRLLGGQSNSRVNQFS